MVPKCVIPWRQEPAQNQAENNVFYSETEICSDVSALSIEDHPIN